MHRFFVSLQCGIIPLPFIIRNPTRPDTIYSALIFAQEESVRQRRKCCLVTFDQPLFIKALDIVLSTPMLKGKINLLMYLQILSLHVHIFSMMFVCIV